jgi:hypothetical protein
MARLTIKLGRCNATNSCALCGKRVNPGGGPHLFLDDGGDDTVCRDCGRLHAPPLAALLDLARVAERVGRIGRHTLVPPLHSLLDLTRAAENYLEAAPVRKRQAA